MFLKGVELVVHKILKPGGLVQQERRGLSPPASKLAVKLHHEHVVPVVVLLLQDLLEPVAGDLLDARESHQQDNLEIDTGASRQQGREHVLRPVRQQSQDALVVCAVRLLLCGRGVPQEVKRLYNVTNVRNQKNRGGIA